jgi:cytidylate kinase
MIQSSSAMVAPGPLHRAAPAVDGGSPVIALDGPTASGKGTVAVRVARALGWHVLDSGALYRLLALSSEQSGVSASDGPALAQLASRLSVRFDAAGQAYLGDEAVGDALRTELMGERASQVALHSAVRQALVGVQRGFRRPPGLVADGRDMGTVIFPDACLKVFLTASVRSRAERRYKQLIEKGVSVNLDEILAELQRRDHRDATRPVAPLVPADDALVLDSTQWDVEQTVAAVLALWTERRRAGQLGQDARRA